MKIKVKRLNEKAILPNYAHPGDVGLDLYSLEDYELQPGERHIFFLGFALEFPDGLAGIIKDKGSLPKNGGIHTMAGVYDAGYRGEYNVNLGSCLFRNKINIPSHTDQKFVRIKICEIGLLSFRMLPCCGGVHGFPPFTFFVKLRPTVITRNVSLSLCRHRQTNFETRRDFSRMSHGNKKRMKISAVAFA